LYVRPGDIEAATGAALAQDLATLCERIAVRDRRSSEYLASECLVHVIREARRRGDGNVTNALLPLLLGRCEGTLCSKLPDTFPFAAELREEVIGQLAELFAQDGTGDNPDELDFYEVRFNSALRTLRIDIVRKQTPRIEHEVSLSELLRTETAADDEALDRLGKQFHAPPTHEHAVLLRELLDTMTPEERDAVVLCRIMGYDEESEDPTRITAATLCGVTGRTIRNRLRRAAAKAFPFKEDL
jgi:hypothetical protein